MTVQLCSHAGASRAGRIIAAILLAVLLSGIPHRMSADDAFYDSCYQQVTYVFDNVGSSKALAMLDEMRDHAERHGSKYGFYIVTILNAHIAKDMGMYDRAEELILQAIDYQKRHLPKKKTARVYFFLAAIYEAQGRGEKAVQVLDRALSQSGWSGEDRVFLWSLKCNAVAKTQPVDTVRFMAYYAKMQAEAHRYGYRGEATLYTDCHHAKLIGDYARLLTMAERIDNKGVRLRFKIAALDGLNQNQEALDSFRLYKEWTDRQASDDMRRQAELSALELEAARAENEAFTLQLHHHRVVIVVIVCGTLLLAAYLYRRLRQIRQLRQAYGQLEQAYEQLEQVTTQKERIESELRIAREIQMSSVPTDFPSLQGLGLYASMTPAKAVGGDLYDFFVRDGQLFFCIGDVSGKGVPAALFMMVTKSLFRVCSSTESSPDEIVSQMNKMLSENNRSCMFVTFFAGVLDLSSGLLRYCSAGHEDPIVISREASFLPLRRVFPAGVSASTVYEAQELVLSPQTTLLLYTDGLTEAVNADDEMLGRESVLSEANHAILAGKTAPGDLVERMRQTVSDFVGGTEQSDDLTLLAIQFEHPKK